VPGLGNRPVRPHRSGEPHAIACDRAAKKLTGIWRDFEEGQKGGRCLDGSAWNGTRGSRKLQDFAAEAI